MRRTKTDGSPATDEQKFLLKTVKICLHKSLQPTCVKDYISEMETVFSLISDFKRKPFSKINSMGINVYKRLYLKAAVWVGGLYPSLC